MKFAPCVTHFSRRRKGEGREHLRTISFNLHIEQAQEGLRKRVGGGRDVWMDRTAVRDD